MKDDKLPFRQIDEHIDDRHALSDRPISIETHRRDGHVMLFHI
jgi:hypothetical protein